MNEDVYKARYVKFCDCSVFCRNNVSDEQNGSLWSSNKLADRGIDSVDWAREGNSNQATLGNYSIIKGGQINAAKNIYSIVGGGQNVSNESNFGVSNFGKDIDFVGEDSFINGECVFSKQKSYVLNGKNFNLTGNSFILNGSNINGENLFNLNGNNNNLIVGLNYNGNNNFIFSGINLNGKENRIYHEEVEEITEPYNFPIGILSHGNNNKTNIINYSGYNFVLNLGFNNCYQNESYECSSSFKKRTKQQFESSFLLGYNNLICTSGYSYDSTSSITNITNGCNVKICRPLFSYNENYLITCNWGSNIISNGKDINLGSSCVYNSLSLLNGSQYSGLCGEGAFERSSLFNFEDLYYTNPSPTHNPRFWDNLIINVKKWQYCNFISSTSVPRAFANNTIINGNDITGGLTSSRIFNSKKTCFDILQSHTNIVYGSFHVGQFENSVIKRCSSYLFANTKGTLLCDVNYSYINSINSNELTISSSNRSYVNGYNDNKTGDSSNLGKLVYYNGYLYSNVCKENQINSPNSFFNGEDFYFSSLSNFNLFVGSGIYYDYYNTIFSCSKIDYSKFIGSNIIHFQELNNEDKKYLSIFGNNHFLYKKQNYNGTVSSNCSYVNNFNKTLFGNGGKLTRPFEVKHSNGFFVNTGDAQVTTTILAKRTENNTPANLLIGNCYNFYVQENVSTKFELLILGQNSDNLDTVGYKVKGLYHKNSLNDLNFIGQPIIDKLGDHENCYSVNLNLNKEASTFDISVVGDTGNNMNWVAKAKLIEIET